MGFVAGLFVALGSIVAAVLHLQHDAKNFWDFVAFACVTGGTLAVGLMTLPWQYRRQIFRSFLSLFYNPRKDDGQVLRECMRLLSATQNGQRNVEVHLNSLAGEILKDGVELIGLGLSKDKVHDILEERIHQSFERSIKVANSMRALAKYPPAFGLAGTVLGLVSLMRKVSDGADAKQTGLLMAIALMATFYGLLVANLLINPAGEHMQRVAYEERKRAEIALHSIVLMAEGASLLEAQEILNSYVSKEKRLNLLDGTAAAA